MRFTDFRLPIFDCHKNRALPEEIFKGQSGSDSGLRVSCEMTIDAFGEQPFATALATTGKGGASAFRAHASPKTVLLLSCALGSL